MHFEEETIFFSVKTIFLLKYIHPNLRTEQSGRRRCAQCLSASAVNAEEKNLTQCMHTQQNRGQSPVLAKAPLTKGYKPAHPPVPSQSPMAMAVTNQALRLLARHLPSCIMCWFFSVHREAYFVLDLSVTSSVLTLPLSLGFCSSLWLYRKTVYWGEILLAEQSARPGQSSLCTAFHYGRVTVGPRCILISSLNTLPLFLSPKHWHRCWGRSHTGCLGQAQFICKVSADALKQSVWFLLVWIWTA